MNPFVCPIEEQQRIVNCFNKPPASLVNWCASWPKLFKSQLDANKYGDLPDWQASLNQHPASATQYLNLTADAPEIGSNTSLTTAQKDTLKRCLMALHPWRKGPFNLCGLHIDTEWQCQMKWSRIASKIDLKGHNILDVGCGNGYYALRMLGQGANSVIGIDPSIKYWFQWAALAQHLPNQQPFWYVPTVLEDLPQQMPVFDTVFSMGVLYHRKDPIGHLEQLRNKISNKGQVVLETLTVPGDKNTCLIPENRYAKMRNIWFLPSIAMFETWCKRSSFKHIELLDSSQTTPQEQRQTQWMTFHSLPQFLDPNDSNKTCEGYPAPQRTAWLLK